MEHIVKILATHPVTHDVKSFTVEKPAGYSFVPGQATDVSINTSAWKNELRPFTFTSLDSDPHLEFTIKRYPEHHGVTDALHRLRVGDELILHDVWGAINYQGPGCFIAGGAGITPFLAILRWLRQTGQEQGNTLLFSNRAYADIIQEAELRNTLGNQAIFYLTQETKDGFRQGELNQQELSVYAVNTALYFYICGPDKMVTDLADSLRQLGVNDDRIVVEA